MGTRELLALSRIDEFKSWAIEQGYTSEPLKGVYEVLRLRMPGTTVAVFFKRLSTHAGKETVHATCQDNGKRIVRKWLRDRKEKETNASRD